jgi:Zn-dependent protease with chaperone function
MSVETVPEDAASRLNPFAFPSETTLRFVLLVLFVLCGSVELYGSFGEHFNPEAARAAERCVSDMVQDLRTLSGTADETAAAAKTRIMPKIARCSELLRPRAIWKLAGVMVTVVLAGAIFLLLPIAMLKRRGLIPVTRSQAPGLLEELQELGRSVGLAQVPVAVWNPLSVSTPYVFGSRTFYCAFSGAFVSRLYDDKAMFRTVVLHELAHIARRDVRKIYLTVATSVAFIASQSCRRSWRSSSLRIGPGRPHSSWS